MHRRGVVAVVGIVVGSVVLTACPPPTPVPDPAVVARCRLDERTLITAVAAYRALNGVLPASEGDLLDFVDVAVFDHYAYADNGDGTYTLTPLGDCIGI